MGNFKEKNREGVREIQENSKETKELGTKMTDMANEIESVLESIDLRDTEDIGVMNETGHSYQDSFNNAFSEQVETAEQDIEQQGDQIQEAAGSELENVHSGISKLERAENISEIGRNAAETGRSKLEGSAAEYEDIISDAENVVNETDQQIESLKNNLSGIF